MDNRPPCRIALIENDPAIAASILATLRGAGHACRRFAGAATALKEIDGDGFDLMLVAHALPNGAARALIAGVRARFGFALPVIGLVAAGDAEAQARMLEDGADDCLPRPAPPRLLLAQIDAALRRGGTGGPRIEAAIGHLTFQPEGTRAYVAGTPVVLTAKEYALALMLCRNLGKPLGREAIFSAIWGGAAVPLTRTLDVHVSRLRTKLELRPDRGFALLALYGRGYRLDYAHARMDRAIVPAGTLLPPPPATIEHRAGLR